jgi:hypothetical protein
LAVITASRIFRMATVRSAEGGQFSTTTRAKSSAAARIAW